MAKKLIEVNDLVIKFNLRGKIFPAIRAASIDLYENETLAIVGESGSGKSVLTKSLIGMVDSNGFIESGSMTYDGLDLRQIKTAKEWQKIRGKEIAMVFQDPMTALNPLKKIGKQIEEMVLLHTDVSKEKAKEEVLSLMEKVGITDCEKRYHQYPHEFSGGMRQRIVIATAIAARPKVLICDEPTTALDVTLQAQILKLMKDIQKEFGLSIIFITHDLGVVASVADRVAVIYSGEIIEKGTSDEIFHAPVHPYTKALLSSLPQVGEKGKELPAIKGTPPNLFKDIVGDAFAPRNIDALKIDLELEPPLMQISETHFAKTWLMHEYAIEKYGDPSKIERKFEQKERSEASEESFDKKEVLLSLKDVSIDYGSGKKKFHAVKKVSFDIYKGETLSLVGESGSGKTTVGRAIMKIIPTSNGEINFAGKKINRKLNFNELRDYRQNVQMIFQDPMASLNERAKVDYIISEGLYNYKLFKSEEERKQKVSSVMSKVGLSPDFASRFPHEFSGGQRQRVGIARALVMNPSFIVADEPISALDVSIRAQVINLLNDLKRDNDLTYLFIAHDLSVVRFISDRIAVIYKGEIVELAPSEELFLNPLHPYTNALLSAIPIPEPDIEKKKVIVKYEEKETNEPKNFKEVKDGHFVLCTENEFKEYQTRLK